jgi:hypothetical protein
MLGRLKMSLKDCKNAYIRLSESVFTPVNIIQHVVGFPHLGPKFQTAPLERAIQDILKDALKCTNEGAMRELLKEDEDETKVDCKV